MCLTIKYEYEPKRTKGKGYKVVRVSLGENPTLHAPCREYEYNPTEWNEAQIHSRDGGFHIYTRLSDAKRAFPDYANALNSRYETVKLYCVAYDDVLSHGLGDGGFTPVPALRKPTPYNQPIVVLARKMKLIEPIEVSA